jgi:hypothetical protein
LATRQVKVNHFSNQEKCIMNEGNVGRFRKWGIGWPRHLVQENAMRKFRAMLMAGGCTMLGFLVWTLPANAQGLGSTSSSAGGTTTRTSSGSGSSGLGSGGASSGATLGGANFLQGTSNFLTPATTATTNANRNAAGNRAGTGTTNSATGTGSAFPGIAASNLLGSYYANPLAAGLPSGTTQPRFGAPLYTITTANLSSTGAGGAGGANRGGTATTSSSNAYAGSSSVGIRRAPAYATTIGFEFAAPSMTSMQTSLQQTIAESTRLPSKANMTVVVDGETVVLRGTASSDRERRMAEALVRLTPGVHDVRNDLEVR